jgi:transposase
MRDAQFEWRGDDTVEALLARYRAEKDGELKTRWQALWLLRRGEPRSEVADVLGVNPRTLRDWIAWYAEGGCSCVAAHRRGAGGGGVPRLAWQQRAQIRDGAAEGRFRGVAAAQEWVRQEFGVDYTYWGMRSVLDRMLIHRRVPRPLAANADLAAQEAWVKGGSGER